MGNEDKPLNRNQFFRFMFSMYDIIDKPITYVREKLVTPNQQHYPYYHQKFRRVPTIETCYKDDHVCKYEAQDQFLRDRMVDCEILNILRERFEQCVMEDWNQREEEKCNSMWEYYLDAAGAWFTKYGDLGPQPKVSDAFMKQRHRMVWERRHGPVGSGMKVDPFKVEEDETKVGMP